MAIKKYFSQEEENKRKDSFGTFTGTINNLYRTTRTIALDQNPNSAKQNEDNNSFNYIKCYRNTSIKFKFNDTINF